MDRHRNTQMHTQRDTYTHKNQWDEGLERVPYCLNMYIWIQCLTFVLLRMGSYWEARRRWHEEQELQNSDWGISSHLGVQVFGEWRQSEYPLCNFCPETGIFMNKLPRPWRFLDPDCVPSKSWSYTWVRLMNQLKNGDSIYEDPAHRPLRREMDP